MSRFILIALAATLGCASSSADQKPDAVPGKAPTTSQGQPQTQTPPPPPGTGGTPASSNAFTTGRQRVKGGEIFALNGPITVTVKQVTYVNQPCPAGAQCITSGIIRTVQFEVVHGADTQQMSVNAGTFRVAAGVQLHVLNVEPGPLAEIEASLPVGEGQ
ncbi:MAG: hypothetical protein JST54_10075 [Deltaproteobacteria bacterium]|nr:hypothetical protein [Deltaproteobacteria bacterium]